MSTSISQKPGTPSNETHNPAPSDREAPALAVAPTPMDAAKPFDGDLFRRSELASRLTGFLNRLPDGGVIAIDAGWGEGKSWFGERWHASLKTQGYRTAFIDAFAADYLDDPYLLLTSEVMKVLSAGSPESKKFTERAVSLGKVLLPALGKGAVRAVTKFVVGEKGADELHSVVASAAEAATDSLGEDLGKVLRDRLKALEKRQKVETAFKAELQNLASVTAPRPLVIFVDELDRCRPTFAVQFLERAKHFFEVPGVVFVLLLSRLQLEAAVRHIYGEIDARLYLSKFITLIVSLPKHVDPVRRHGDFQKHYIEKTGRRLGYRIGLDFENFRNALGGMAGTLGMSYRELDRAMAYFGTLGPITYELSDLVGYLVALRVSKREAFKTILDGDYSGGLKFVNELIVIHGPDAYPLQKMAFLYIAVRDGIERVPEAEREEVARIGETPDQIKAAFSRYARLLDFSLRLE
jgi:hypothetical protein